MPPDLEPSTWSETYDHARDRFHELLNLATDTGDLEWHRLFLLEAQVIALGVKAGFYS